MEKFKLSPCGSYIALMGGNGWMNLLSAASGQWIAGAKVEGTIADVEWHHIKGKNARISIATKAGEIYEWDVESRSFVNRWKDEGGIGITSIALGGVEDRWCAIGSQSGIVHVYDRKDLQIGIKLSLDEAPIMKPAAVLDQLVTTITALRFSPDGQILAMGSRAKRDAFRLCHVPSFTVFKNWPTSGTPLGKVTCVDFTPGTEMLCVGNEGGHVRLWKLSHYF
jgi:U3 small nucleolar RNA-associated protein 18